MRGVRWDYDGNTNVTVSLRDARKKNNQWHIYYSLEKKPRLLGGVINKKC
jgi:hypothetical protein